MKTHSTTAKPLAENPHAVAAAKLALSAITAAMTVAFYEHHKSFRRIGIETGADLAKLIEASAQAVLTEAMRNTNVYRINGGAVAQVTARRAKAADDARLVLAALDDLPEDFGRPLYGVAQAHIRANREAGQ